MPDHIKGLDIIGGDGHYSGAFTDDGKHAGHALLPCPFCGSTKLALTNTHTPSYWVYCLKCDAEAHGNMPSGAGSQIPNRNGAVRIHRAAMRSAVRKWNKRVPGNNHAD
ncbi:Lar family restriction alleviation protein [Burkholderia cenocepacia]|uniref:Lar family restriction alleviation protein n=1 Tax=Burkholderia cenocepacia TaxID=95486 RepID=UPI0020A20619|nr:Lar family restriction alleviation protein [Burkholderia cenocepacia]MCO8325950.1 Lar family restriction alleviation protein [Burkholderia cenocepacia]MCO8333020.1 Lar family restriction alleviation protein [Burkholderia cenocepacia]MCO8340520.1 Lar family restriction alleviation protein [Burkholderia cenocepacia]MCO8347806.1 Lar family restriction alleviation protein [Burkholderia cenocepacia]MCO8360872.1 Lar family restriction alleviation protein [Burkholderia cenocepacia]